MSYQRPIFNGQQGLFGKANREVMNGLLDSNDVVQQYSQALVWADQQMRATGEQISWFLGRLKTATPIGGKIYQWTYSGNPCMIEDYSGDVTDWNDQSFRFTNAINLRELFNDSGWVDGSDTTNTRTGPVGSTYRDTQSRWDTTDLKCVCVIGIWRKNNGTPLYFFDRPNPVNCS